MYFSLALLSFLSDEERKKISYQKPILQVCVFGRGRTRDLGKLDGSTFAEAFKGCTKYLPEAPLKAGPLRSGAQGLRGDIYLMHTQRGFGISQQGEWRPKEAGAPGEQALVLFQLPLLSQIRCSINANSSCPRALS